MRIYVLQAEQGEIVNTYNTANTGALVISDQNEAIRTVLHFCDHCTKSGADIKKCSGRDKDCQRVKQKILEDFQEK